MLSIAVALFHSFVLTLPSSPLTLPPCSAELEHFVRVFQAYLHRYVLAMGRDLQGRLASVGFPPKQPPSSLPLPLPPPHQRSVTPGFDRALAPIRWLVRTTAVGAHSNAHRTQNSGVAFAPGMGSRMPGFMFDGAGCALPLCDVLTFRGVACTSPQIHPEGPPLPLPNPARLPTLHLPYPTLWRRCLLLRSWLPLTMTSWGASSAGLPKG